MRFYFLFALVFALPLLNGCSKKGDDAPVGIVGIAGGVVSLPAGTYALVGIIDSVNPNCGAALVNVTATAAYGGGQIGNAPNLPVGGSFSFGIPNGGYGGTTYTLNVSAGQCYVSGQVPALTNGMQPYRICLDMTGACQYRSAGGMFKMASKAGGSIDSAFTGSGDFSFNSTQISLTPKKAGNFSLSLTYTSGNNLLTASPGVVDGTWKGSVNADGSIKISDVSAAQLSYGSQVDASLLQYDQTFCGSASDAIQKMSDYAQASGFSAKAIAGLKASWTAAAVSSSVCVYPQDSKVVDAVVALKSDNNLIANRAWFAVVPTGEISGKKFVPSDKVAKLTSKAKVGKLVATKKAIETRKVASDNDLLAEELGFGFVIQK